MFKPSVDSGNLNELLLANSGLAQRRWSVPVTRWWMLLLTIGACAFAGGQCPISVTPATPTGDATNSRTIVANANCGAGSFVSGLNWGDESQSVSGPSPLVVNHIYGDIGPFPLTASNGSTSTPTATALVAFPTTPIPSSEFAGQPATVTTQIATAVVGTQDAANPAGDIFVTFRCASVIDSNGKPVSLQQMNITCAARNSPVRLPAPNSDISSLPGGIIPAAVTVDVTTSGLAPASVATGATGMWLLSIAWMPVPAALFLGIFPARKRRGRVQSLLGIFAVLGMSLSLISCGGGFKLPANPQATTPAGIYHVVVVDDPTVPFGGFVQTSLIVPLNVSEFQ